MELDLVTVAALTALVVNTCGVVFIVETLVRRDEGAGRIWALGFLAGMLTTLAYMIWAIQPSMWWAVAVGNAAFVASTGCMWLGCRRYNHRAMQPAAIFIGVVALAAYFAVLIAGDGGGDWAGAGVMFAALAVLAGLGCAEALRGEMGRQRTAWGLAFVFGLECVYYVVRFIVLLALGDQHPVFLTWFGTIGASFLTIPLTVVALVVTSVLRAGRADMRGFAHSGDGAGHEADGSAADGILPHDAFRTTLEQIVTRAQWRRELVAVVSVRIEDLEQIATAFGGETAGAVRDAWRHGVRRYPPSDAIVGEDGLSGALVCTIAESPAEARRQAALVYRGVFEDLGAVVGGVIPVLGVGVALSSTFGYDAAALERAAREAAAQATLSVESSVLVGEAQHIAASAP